MACAQRSPEHPYLRSFIPSGQLRLHAASSARTQPLGFQARRLLRRTRTLLSIVSLCPDRSSWSSSATGKDAAAGSPTLLLPSEEEAKKKIYNVSCERYFGFGCEIDEETSHKLEVQGFLVFPLCSLIPMSTLRTRTREVQKTQHQLAELDRREADFK